MAVESAKTSTLEGFGLKSQLAWEGRKQDVLCEYSQDDERVATESCCAAWTAMPSLTP
jgi:hypothetical protein